MASRINPFRGTGVALVTPFDENGNVDYKTLADLFDWQISEGKINFACILGTTAETPCLTDEEKEKIKRTAVDVAAGRIPLVLGCGTNNTHQLCDNLKNGDFKGFDGVLLVSPFYNKPSQEGLYMHYRMAASASPLPIVLYNVPSRTGVNIEAETALRLANDFCNVVAVKEASGKMGQISKLIANAPSGFDVLSGDDAITLPMISMGAKGVISVVANAYPQRFVKMVKLALDENISEARKIQNSLTNLYHLLSVDGNPSGIKSLLAIMGKIKPGLRLPLVEARQETIKALELEIANLTK